MEVRTRQRDPEAEAVADKIIGGMSLRDDQKPVARLGALRGYREGKAAGKGAVEALESHVERQTAVIEKLRSKTSTMAGFTPGEVRYIEVLNTYGMSPAQIGALFTVGPNAIAQVLEEIANPVVRYGAAVQRGAKGRLLQA